MLVKMLVMVFLFSIAPVFAQDKFEDLDVNTQHELMSILNPAEIVAAEMVVTKPPARKKQAVKKDLDKVIEDAAKMSAAMQKEKEKKLMFVVDIHPAGMSKAEADKLDGELVEMLTKQTISKIVQPKDGDVERQWIKKQNKILVKAKIMSALEPLELSVSVRLSSFRNEVQVNPERGFVMTSSNQTGMRPGFSIQAKYKKVGGEIIPSTSHDKLELAFYGSGLGSQEIETGPAGILKFFVYEDEKYSLSIGVGVERVRISGWFSIGGFRATTKYNKLPTIIQIGGEYKINKDFAIGMNYEISNLRTSSGFPGMPAQGFARDGCLVFTGNYRFLKQR